MDEHVVDPACAHADHQQPGGLRGGSEHLGGFLEHALGVDGYPGLGVGGHGVGQGQDGCGPTFVEGVAERVRGRVHDPQRHPAPVCFRDRPANGAQGGARSVHPDHHAGLRGPAQLVHAGLLSPTISVALAGARP